MTGQNTSAAVMAQRAEPHDSLDFFPTPLWATRALCDLVLRQDLQAAMRPEDDGRLGMAGRAPLTAWEPACGAGHMAEPLAEFFKTVYASDVHDYGYRGTVPASRDGADWAGVHDFLQPYVPQALIGIPIDWIIGNPPFRLALEFIRRAIGMASAGVAMLVRLAFLESETRYSALFRDCPPDEIAQFVERVPMVKGRLSKEATTATAYAWLIWRTDRVTIARQPRSTKFTWIPPCRARLQRDADWITPPAPIAAAGPGPFEPTERKAVLL